MYYTTDGTTPTTGSTLYTGPFTLNVAHTVKAIAVATDYVNSAVATSVFTRPAYSSENYNYRYVF
jgi:hypothetical protein